MYGAVLQCLHSGYKLLLQLPHGVIYGVKEATSNSILIRLSQMTCHCLKDEQRKAILKVLEGNH